MHSFLVLPRVFCIEFFSGDYTVFANEAEFESTLTAFLATPEGFRYNRTVIFGSDGGIDAAAIQMEYSGVINGEASEQVIQSTCNT